MVCNEALDIIKKWEGFREKAYLCPAGVWTIGYGSTRYRNGSNILPGDKISLEEAEALLGYSVGKFELGVRSVAQSVSEGQLGAMVSFSYNLGLTALKISSLLHYHNLGDYERAADEFPKWKFAKVHGKKTALNGLLMRRLDEQALYLRPD